MKKIIFGLIILIASFSANSACSIKTLKGFYVASGTYMGYSNNTPVSCGIVARLAFDGKGFVSVKDYETCSGAWINNGSPVINNGTYSIDSTCTGVIRTNDISFVFILNNSMKEGSIIGANVATGLSGSGTIIKQ